MDTIQALEAPATTATTATTAAAMLGVRLAAAKRSYTTRHLPLHEAGLLLSDRQPAAGDAVLATVATVGHHTKIESTHGRRQQLYPGDEVLVVFGNRYAPDQFEAVVPTGLGPCHLVAAGGIASQVVLAHRNMRPATELTPIGIVADVRGQPLNLGGRCSVRTTGPARPDPGPSAATSEPVTIAVVGASMNAGKTTAAAHLMLGLHRAGLRVGAAKVTGTGAGGDMWQFTDAGARPALDFTDAGVPSTYRVAHHVVRQIFLNLTDRLTDEGCDVRVLEVADGVYQQETAELIDDPVFMDRVDGVLFATVDALSAVAGVDWLHARGIRPLALTGVLSSSPLASREATRATGEDVWECGHLADPAFAAELVEHIGDNRLGHRVTDARMAG